jgi:hypothetical protein
MRAADAARELEIYKELQARQRERAAAPRSKVREMIFRMENR